VQVVQVPVQLALVSVQQIPSLHAPVVHWALLVQAPPGPVCVVHTPVGLQYFPAGHVSGSNPLVTVVHAPVVAAQVVHVPVQ
jgi:hypothetical protein